MKHLFVKGLQPPPQGQPPWYPGANGGVTFGADPPPNPIRGHFWWDGNLLWLFDGINWVTDGFSKALFQEMVAADPSLIETPIVTDGSLADFNDVGYIWNATGSGTWTGSGSNSQPPLLNLIPTSPPLPAGDWNVSWQMIMPSATSTTGVSTALLRLPTPLPPGCMSNMQGYAVNIPTNAAPGGDTPTTQPLIITGPTTAFSNASQLGLVFNLFVWASGLGVTGPYTLNLWGRRVR